MSSAGERLHQENGRSKRAPHSSSSMTRHADSRATASEQAVRPVAESLDRLNDRIHRLETSGASWRSQLKQQVPPWMH